MKNLLVIVTYLSLLSIVSCTQKKYSIDEIVCSKEGVWLVKSDSSIVNGLVYNNQNKVGSILNGKAKGNGNWVKITQTNKFENYITLN